MSTPNSTPTAMKAKRNRKNPKNRQRAREARGEVVRDETVLKAVTSAADQAHNDNGWIDHGDKAANSGWVDHYAWEDAGGWIDYSKDFSTPSASSSTAMADIPPQPESSSSTALTQAVDQFVNLPLPQPIVLEPSTGSHFPNTTGLPEGVILPNGDIRFLSSPRTRSSIVYTIWASKPG